jgi:hypothetical protein
MKKLLLLTLMALAIHTQAQNVGIGNPTPTEKLDVTGNINVTGTIKANGVDGAAGQVLTNNGNGTIAWSSADANLKYKFCKIISTTSTFTIPAGVTEIMVELWGAGAGSTTIAGGFSGNFVRSVYINQIPGSVHNITIGAGGQAGNNSLLPTSGGSTMAFGATAYGGRAATSEANYGDVDVGYVNSYSIPGNQGDINRSEYGQINATTFTETRYYGLGGLPPGKPFINRPVGSVQRFTNGVAGPLTTALYASDNMLKGMGGSVYNQNSGGTGSGGQVIIWWN